MNFKYYILTFNFSTDDRLKNDLLKYYAKNDNVEVIPVSSHDEVVKITKQGAHVALLAKVDNREQILTIINTLSYHKKKNANIYSVVLTTSKSKKLESVLNKNGCNEILKPDTNYRTISFKIDNQIKKLVLSGAQSKDTYDSKSFKKNATKKNNKAEIKFIDPLNMDDDVWSSRSETDHKKFLRRWLVRLKGPSLQVGKWIEIESKSSKVQYWKFVFDEGKKDLFCPGNGAWIFQGNKPEFDWKHEWWTFSSERPAMFFLEDDGKKHYRFFADKENVFIRSNSDISAEKLALIEETCHIKHKIESEKRAKKDEGTKIKPDSHLDKYLRGEDGLGADELKDLTGKSNYKEDEIEKNYKGDVSSKLEKEEKEANKSSFKEEARPGHYKGASQTERKVDNESERKTSTSNSVKTGDKQSDFKEDAIDKHYKGETGTDKKTDSSKKNDKKIGSQSTDDLLSKKAKELEIERKSRSLEKKKNEEKERKAQELAKKLEKLNKEHLEKDYEQDKNEINAKDNKKTKADNEKGKDERSMLSDQSKKLSRNNEKQKTEPVNEAKPHVKDSELSQRTKNKPELKKTSLQNSNEKKPLLKGEQEGSYPRPNKNMGDANKSQEENSQLNDEKQLDNVISLDRNKEKNESSNHASSTESKKQSLQAEVKERTEYGEDYYRIGVGTEEEVSTESGQVIIKIVKENNVEKVVTFNDLYPEELTVTSEESDWQEEEVVSVRLELIYNKEHILLKFKGVVEEKESLAEETLYVFKVHNLSSSDYERFMKLYAKRQDNIHSFMFQAKGA